MVCSRLNISPRLRPPTIERGSSSKRQLLLCAKAPAREMMAEVPGPLPKTNPSQSFLYTNTDDLWSQTHVFESKGHILGYHGRNNLILGVGKNTGSRMVQCPSRKNSGVHPNFPCLGLKKSLYQLQEGGLAGA